MIFLMQKMAFLIFAEFGDWRVNNKGWVGDLTKILKVLLHYCWLNIIFCYLVEHFHFPIMSLIQEMYGCRF